MRLTQNLNFLNLIFPVRVIPDVIGGSFQIRTDDLLITGNESDNIPMDIH